MILISFSSNSHCSSTELSLGPLRARWLDASEEIPINALEIVLCIEELVKEYMRKSSKMQQQSSYYKFKNIEFIEVEKAERNNFLIILKARSRNYDWHLFPFLC